MSQKQADTKPTQRVGGILLRLAGIIAPAALCVAAALYINNVMSYEVAVRVSVNGVPAGYIESQDDIAGVRTSVLTEIDDASEGTYTAELDVTYDFVHTKDPVYLTEDEYAQILWAEFEEDFTEAYMLYVDDNRVGATADDDDLHELIDDIQAEMLASGGAAFENVRIASELRIEKQLCLKSMIRSVDEINELINPLADAAEKSAAEQSAAERSAAESDVSVMRISAFSAAAPAVMAADEAADRSGNEDTSSDPVLDYNFINTVTLNEVIYFETEYVDDPEEFVGNESLVREGSDGEKLVTYELIYNENGQPVARNAISETVITPAQSKIISRGSMEIPDAVPTGSFIWPCEQPSGVSSGYGWRDLYGRPDFHLGIDIPDSKGSPIWAADGGTVLWAKTTPSYGKSVLILHSDGFSTLYAHLNEILVSEGDEVYKKQTIGTMGNTGVAYGTHLHFEVRINDSTVNPIDYLPQN